MAESGRTRMTGAQLTVLIVAVVVGLFILGAVVIAGFVYYLSFTSVRSNFAEAEARSRVSRVRSDMRSMATAIETYKVDYKVYPPSTSNMEITPMRDLAKKHSQGEWNIPTFTSAITTPIGYLTSLFPDPFAEEEERTFQYYLHPSGDGWIMWSPGPDGKYQLDWTIYNPTVPQPSPELLTGAGPEGAYTYDPTNGLGSPGVLWRVKQ